jgi:predicted transposase/invertase (TIGR01784 family)
MPLGIKPTVDFAFKKIFGSPQNTSALIGLLNAILDRDHPIEAVTILNPFNYQEFAESKLIVLDIRCRDSAGRWLNVEMQVSVYSGLLERLVYYACSMYVDQLEIGDGYGKATPSISICLLQHPHFGDTEQPHHGFQMIDAASGRRLKTAIEVHTVELSKYHLSEATITSAGKLHQWVFLLRNAQDYDEARLRELLPGIDFDQAIGTIATISAKSEDRQMYDQREKALRDYEWGLSSAREEGHEKGLQEGLEQGLEQGLERGLAKGRQEGKIQMLQELLGDPILGDAELLGRTPEELENLLSILQQRLRDRQA